MQYRNCSLKCNRAILGLNSHLARADPDSVGSEDYILVRLLYELNVANTKLGVEVNI